MHDATARRSDVPALGTRDAPTGEDAPERHSPAWISYLFGAALVVTVVVAVTHASEGREFARLLRHARPAWVGFAVALQALTYLTDAAIWYVVLRAARCAQPIHSLVSLGFAKLFIDQAIPSGGLSGTLVVVKGLERREVPRPSAMAAVVIDLLTFYSGYTASIVVGLVALAANGRMTAAALIPTAIFVAIAAAMFATVFGLSRGKVHLPDRVARLRVVAPLVEAVKDADPALTRRAGLLACCFGFQAAIFALDAVTVWALLRAVACPRPMTAVYASYMMSSMARTLGIAPGGLGTYEAASVGTLRLLGTPLSAALAATLLFRGLSFWIPLVPGVYFGRRESKGASSSGGA